MYCDYFGLSREPFSIAPDPAFIYPSPHHRQALAHLKYGLEREGGFLLLTGEVGTGKTTLVRLLIEQIPASFRIAYILNATLDRLDVLASICEELGLEVDAEAPSAKTYVDQINADLLKAHAEGRKTLVIIEEAQNLSPDVLEMLRLLTNLETNTTKLLHILLVGQPELLETIALPELRQLNQRIVSRFHLQPLDRSETERYLNHRLSKAGCSRQLFEVSAVRRMHQLAEGVPRKLNLIAERALLGAFAENREKVGVAQVSQARQEVFGNSLQQRKFTSNGAFWALASVVLVVLVVAFYVWQRPESVTPVLEVSEPALVPAAEVQVVVEPEPEPLAESIQELVAVALDSNEPSSVQSIFSRLLGIWFVAQSAGSTTELCSVASENGLFCAEQSLGSVAEVLAVNRPMVIILGGQQSILLGVQEGQMELLSATGQQLVSQQDFINRWNGEVTYLWRPPPGYNGSLRPGDRNSAVVSWLLEQLQQIDAEQPELITGGNYSQAVAQTVAEFQASHGLASDGVLGQKTLMKINELAGVVPLLERGG